MTISLIHPTRSRPDKSIATISKWISLASDKENLELIISTDNSDPFKEWYQIHHYPMVKGQLIRNDNANAVQAINKGAEAATGELLVVVSDDTECFLNWDVALLKEVEGKEDFLLKTYDGIQDYIVTMTVMDRKYYERDKFIYHPDFSHQFADTYLTVLADSRGRLLHSKLKFNHAHYSHSGGKEKADDLNRRNDATWMQGQDTFFKLINGLDTSKITNKGMVSFIKRKGKP